jgi:hypothetical protein
MVMKKVLPAAAGLALLAWLPAAAAPPPELASYRALFDLSLDESSDKADTADVDGRMAVEFVGSRCAGYKSKMRLVTNGENGDGDRQVTDARTETTEYADGRFEFNNETYVNDTLAEQSVGTAQRGPGGIAVKLTKPEARTFTLDSAVAFPTEQMNRLLDAARTGEHFVAMDVFDGSQTGDVVYSTATVIAAGTSAANDFGDETLVGDAGIAGLTHWPLTVSYFDKGAGTDDTPAYVMSFVTYDNGIGRKLRIDYGKFALVGKLTRLEILPTPAC